jgi:hypothetical protein
MHVFKPKKGLYVRVDGNCFFMLVHEVRVGTCQTYSQSHKLEVTKVTWQSGGDRNNLALSKFIN